MKREVRNTDEIVVFGHIFYASYRHFQKLAPLLRLINRDECAHSSPHHQVRDTSLSKPDSIHSSPYHQLRDKCLITDESAHSFLHRLHAFLEFELESKKQQPC